MARALVCFGTVLAALGCAASPPPGAVHPAETGPATPVTTGDPLFRGCLHVVEGGGIHKYDCDGLTASLLERREPRTAEIEDDLDAMISGLTEGFAPLREKFQARIRVERRDAVIGGQKVRAAKVMADHPTEAGAYYGAGFVVVMPHKAMVCTASTGEGLQRCNSVLESFVSLGRP